MMCKRIVKRLLSIILISVMCMVLPVSHVHAAPPSYQYSYWGDTVAAPAAYIATRIIDGDVIGAGALQEPADIHVTDDQEIYILDSGNQRVIITNHRFELIRIIDGFVNEGRMDSFNNPQGIFVTADNR